MRRGMRDLAARIVRDCSHTNPQPPHPSTGLRLGACVVCIRLALRQSSRSLEAASTVADSAQFLRDMFVEHLETLATNQGWSQEFIAGLKGTVALMDEALAAFRAQVGG